MVKHMYLFNLLLDTCILLLAAAAAAALARRSP
jgi:hypothetical protein